MSRPIPLMVVSVVLAAAAAWACSPYAGANPVADQLAHAIGAAADDAAAENAIADLRAMGPEGLKPLLAERDSLARELESPAIQPATAKSVTDRLARLDRAIARVAAQRDAHLSRLYWYTDLDTAKAAAHAAGKPILSLRMLGLLTDECSCANSRFFRTALYANKEISDYLRANYILHWRSVRPVPTVTIDYGDGRKLMRTITGNSIHYVLDSEGRVVDGLPGLYGPAAFKRWLAEMHTLVVSTAPYAAEDRERLRIAYHERRIDHIKRAWSEDLEKVAPDVAMDVVKYHEPARQIARQAAQNQAAANRGAAPTAVQAARRVGAKTQAEAPLLREIASDARDLDRATDDELWKKIAALHAEDARLDAASVAVVRRDNPPTARQAARAAVAKTRVEDPILRMVRQFESSIALDGVRNEYLLHRQLHEWFAAQKVPADVEQLNERVYAELFLTPSSDPWLGLAPEDTYTALERGGKVEQ